MYTKIFYGQIVYLFDITNKKYITIVWKTNNTLKSYVNVISKIGLIFLQLDGNVQNIKSQNYIDL